VHSNMLFSDANTFFLTNFSFVKGICIFFACQHIPYEDCSNVLDFKLFISVCRHIPSAKVQ
jgi:hypothetical protein